MVNKFIVAGFICFAAAASTSAWAISDNAAKLLQEMESNNGLKTACPQGQPAVLALAQSSVKGVASRTRGQVTSKDIPEALGAAMQKCSTLK